MEEDCVGATKVKDGLFVGDQYAGQVTSTQDLEFVVANKVTHVVNCAAATLPNHWEPIGVKYLSYSWLDADDQQILDPSDSVLHSTFSFIESAMTEGESVLILSEAGLGRCCLIAAAYLMTRYRWASTKAVEFMRSRQPGMRLNQGFVRQLAALEARLVRAGIGPKTRTWTEDIDEDDEERLVANTYLNAQSATLADYTTPVQGQKVNTLRWTDNDQGDPQLLEDVECPAAKNLVDKGCLVLRSCLKTSASREFRIPLASKVRSARVLAPSDYSNQVCKPPLQPVLEYGKLDAPRTAKKPIPRPQSASKRENSPLTVAKDPQSTRPNSARRESPMRPASTTTKRPSPRENATKLGTEQTRLKRTITTPQRLRTSPVDSRGPVKAVSAASMKKAVWK